ncbi:MAG: hemolysin family protein [Pseudoflavonifractor sp.]|nr:hemolysin family protein [Alloprevotella sp.]MCM1116065.1 hemolysin family protein [Pseudoflavonifractor sp.]
MTETAWLLIALISLLFSALFSGMEIAYISSDRVRVELDANSGGLIGRLIGRFYSNEDLFISTLLVGNNIVLVVYGMGAAALIEPWLIANLHSEALVLLCSTLISTGVILITGEFLPKSIFRINPNLSFKVFALPIFLFYIILYPISIFISFISKGIMKIMGIHSEEQRMGVLTIGDLNQYLETAIDEVNPDKGPVENEVKIFHNALDFSTTHLRDCMQPRREIVAVDIDDTDRDALVKLFTTSGRSKIIVYRDDIDTILGYIHVSELFDPSSNWKDHLKPIIFAPETLLARKLMRRMLQEKRSLAIVVDEFGGTSGLVTLEDLMEEICGDIRDEHDTASDIIARETEPGVYEFSGRIEIDTLRTTYHIDIPEEDDYQTLAGYILHEAGSIPVQGETLIIGDYELTILRRSATRLELIRLAQAKNDNV